MSRNYSNKNLTNLELGNIEFYLNESKNISEIGRFLDKDESTIRKEIKNWAKKRQKLNKDFIEDKIKFSKDRKWKIMRNRTIGINVRVSENEKKKLKRNAKKSGLNLSAYLRKCGLQQEIYAIPDENIYKIYTGIVELKNEFPYLNDEEINEKITKMQSDFLDIYNYKKDGDDNGNNENMGN